MDSFRRTTVESGREPGNFNFDQLFSEILFGLVEEREGKPQKPCYIHGSNYQLPSMGHAGLVKFATKYLCENVPQGIDPVDYFTRVVSRGGTLLPKFGNHLIPVPVRKLTSESSEAEQTEHYRWLGDNHIHVIQQKDGWSRILDMHPLDYTRGFSQLMTAVLNASGQRGYETPLRVSAFDNLRDFFPEGLERGVLFIDGHVGDCCGKHSIGGTVIINGSAGEYFGDTARDTTFYVKGDVGFVTAEDGCKVVICGREKDRANKARGRQGRCNVYEGEVARAMYQREVPDLIKQR